MKLKPKKKTKIRTVAASELSTMKMTCGNEKKFSTVIDGGHRHHWVGIGWVDEGVATPADKAKYPTVKR